MRPPNTLLYEPTNREIELPLAPKIASPVMLVPGDSVVLATQAFGLPQDPAVLLIMGATASMLGWPDELCGFLAAKGFFVVRFDHRDTGQSTTMAPGEGGYSVEDMAGDVISILDAYSIASAHLVGMSLGAYIAQILALEHTQRVMSLTLYAAEPLGWDGPDLPYISRSLLDHFDQMKGVDWKDPTSISEFLLEIDRLSSARSSDFDEDRARRLIERVLARTASPASMFNHSAVTTTQAWAGRYRDIERPLLVLHGNEDPVLPPENGRVLASDIKGARFVCLPHTGHELPPRQFPSLVDHIEHHIRNVEKDR